MVTTTADEKLFDAREHIQGAIESLSEIVVGQCWGHDDYNSDTRKKHREVLNELLELREKL